MRETLVGLIGLLLITGQAVAQSSTDFKIEEYTFNAAGTMLSSVDFQISAGSLGEGIQAGSLSGPSFSMDGGFMPAYVPPGEVINLVFADAQTLQWSAQPSAGAYHLYRAALSALTGANGGSCEQQGITDTTTTDSASPPAGDGWFYLITVENRLGEEGTRGTDSAGAARPETGVCP